MIRAGRMDRLITIQRVTETQDAIGGISSSWATLRQCWAEYLPTSGRETFSFSRPVAGEIVRFLVHWFSGLTEKDRISFDGKTYDIRHVREIGRRELYEITAEHTQ